MGEVSTGNTFFHFAKPVHPPQGHDPALASAASRSTPCTCLIVICQDALGTTPPSNAALRDVTIWERPPVQHRLDRPLFIPSSPSSLSGRSVVPGAFRLLRLRLASSRSCCSSLLTFCSAVRLPSSSSSPSLSCYPSSSRLYIYPP